MGQQLWLANSLGGYFANNDLSKQARVAAQPLMKFRKFCDIEPAAGSHKGEYVLFDKVSNVATAGSTLVETSTIPKTNFTIVQDSLQLLEYGKKIAYLRDSCRKILKHLSLTNATVEMIHG